MSKKPSRKTIVRKLDALVKEIVIARDGKCIVCGTTQNLTPGHLFSRVAYSTRWDLDNVYAQCLNCNFRHESDPYPMIQAVCSKQMTDHPAVDEWLDDLHRKYVTPHKYKTYELEELYNELNDTFEQHDLDVSNENTK
jgi:hypothetical protein